MKSIIRWVYYHHTQMALFRLLPAGILWLIILFFPFYHYNDVCVCKSFVRITLVAMQV